LWKLQYSDRIVVAAIWAYIWAHYHFPWGFWVFDLPKQKCLNGLFWFFFDKLRHFFIQIFNFGDVTKKVISARGGLGSKGLCGIPYKKFFKIPKKPLFVTFCRGDYKSNFCSALSDASKCVFEKCCSRNFAK
jgi:hypothetical protein